VVAYSFKRRFVDPIRVGLGLPPNDLAKAAIVGIHGKCQTIRADRKRHAWPGEELQLYCGMRTKGCFLIGSARCIEVLDIALTFAAKPIVSVGTKDRRIEYYDAKRLDLFARNDGFESWDSMREFWHEEHGSIGTFFGKIIFWRPM
jgi:hypothetical protein